LRNFNGFPQFQTNLIFSEAGTLSHRCSCTSTAYSEFLLTGLPHASSKLRSSRLRKTCGRPSISQKILRNL